MKHCNRSLRHEEARQSEEAPMSIARWNRFAALALASLTVISAAQAADLSAPPLAPAEAEPASEMLEWGAGWYLRGDLSYSDTRVGSLDMNGAGLRNVRTSPAWSAGAGVGYKFFDYFRMDVTVDYRTRVGLDSSGTPMTCGLQVCDVATNTRFRNTLGLVNAYVDLGKYWRITPYVGAGAGLSYNHMGTTFGTVTYPVGTIPGTQIIGVNGASKTQFAWALMAGAGIALDNHATLDLGYRYVSIGNAASQPYELPIVGGGANVAYRGEAKNLRAHEFRIGLRYQID